MTTVLFIFFFFLTTLISQNYAIAEKKYDKQTPPSSQSLSSNEEAKKFLFYGNLQKLKYDHRKPPPSSEGLSSNLKHPCLTIHCNEEAAKKFLFYGNLQKLKYDHRKPPPSSENLSSNLTNEEAKKFLYYANLQKLKYDHRKPPPSSENISSNLTNEEAKKFLYYANLQKLKYDHRKPPPSSKNLSSNLTNEEAKKFLYYANLQKLKYDHRKPPPSSESLSSNLNDDEAKLQKGKYDFSSDLSKLPVNFFKYDFVRNGTRMITMFTNEGNSSLLPKTDPQWTNESWSSLPECGMSTVTGEIRACVDSKESMVKFITPIMGNKVKTLTTPPGKLQFYLVVGPVRTTHSRVTTCHRKGDLSLPHAVYGCHYIPHSRVRVVPLLGADGTRLEALVVCHMDTSSWDPLGFVMQLLNTKPGPPICHFMATDDLLWVRS